MKKVSNIISLALVFASLCSCEVKPLEQPQPDVDGPSDYLPIEFGVNISTRAQIVAGGEGATLEELGVIGYQYANQAGSNWNTAKATTRPNVFTDHPQTLTLNGNYYDVMDKDTGGPKLYYWTGNKYAFFAVCPLGNSNVVISGDELPDTPYVTYKLDKSSVDGMADVMTSSRTDLTASSRYVTFNMIHRLSAVDVDVCNIYEYSYKVDDVTNFEEIDIEITDLSLRFENLHYDTSTIYLDAAGHSVPGASAGYGRTVTYQLIKEGSDEPVEVEFKTDEDAENYQLTAENGMSMFFIPQDDTDLNVTVDVKFKKKRTDGTYLINNNYDYVYDAEGNKTDETEAEGFGTEFFYASKATDFEQSLDEGYRYYVSLNFTSAAVSINIVTAAQWTDQNIDHEFE